MRFRLDRGRQRCERRPAMGQARLRQGSRRRGLGQIRPGLYFPAKIDLAQQRRIRPRHLRGSGSRPPLRRAPASASAAPPVPACRCGAPALRRTGCGAFAVAIECDLAGGGGEGDQRAGAERRAGAGRRPARQGRIRLGSSGSARPRRRAGSSGLLRQASRIRMLVRS